MQKCVYCDFLSAPAGEDVKRKYIEALVCEINITCGLYNDRLSGYQVKTIFFGGGTPSAVKPEYIRDIMKCLNEHFDIAEGAEVTIECNPGTLDVCKADIYRECGINRISFGLQSADNTELKMLGRIHTFEQFKESLSIAEKAGFDNINVDIMSALPGQTMESYKRTVEKVLECNVKHISAYSLIVEEGTPLYDRLDTDYPELPDEDTERQMYYYTEDSLASAGYVHYEISNYARPGYECRHNISYWERTDYLGFGIGAASLFEEIRHTNITDINKYIKDCNSLYSECIYIAGFKYLQLDKEQVSKGKQKNIDNSIIVNNEADIDTAISENTDTEVMPKENILERSIWTDIQKLSLNDRMEEFMFLGLRKIAGISKSEFERTFSKNIYDVYGNVIKENVCNGLLTDKEDRIKLTDRGVDISNVVMAEFLL
jgi:putative oxygen-independent coproporphyrinogen III oxidase